MRLALCLLGLSGVAAGCQLGDDEDEEPGRITISVSNLAAPLDPAVSYAIETAPVLWAVYTAPLTYRHADGPGGTELVPALAESMPTLSSDGRTYTFRLRPGLRYSDGSPVQASDVETAIKRVLLLPSPGARFFQAVVGANAFLKAQDPDAEVQGIRADDQTGEVSIRLLEPDGTFVYSLASQFAAPVPADTPFKVQVKRPPPGVGPFKFADVDPGRRVVLERNSEWEPLDNVPSAQLDRIVIERRENVQRQAQDVSRNRTDFMLDPVPDDLRSDLKREHADRYEDFVTSSSFYLWLNRSIPPFDDPELRHAVAGTVDREALARLYGGRLEPGCNFLPPPMPGHDELDPCPYAGMSSDDAREVLRSRGALGTEVQVWVPAVPPSKQVGELFAEQLKEIGFKPKLKAISANTYFQVIGGDSGGLHAGFGAWLPEFPHPASFMAAVRGDLIPAEGNYNHSHTDEPGLTREIKRLQRLAGLGPDAREGWANIDRRVARDGALITYGHGRHSNFMSERMDFERCSPVHALYLTDLTRLCLD